MATNLTGNAAAERPSLQPVRASGWRGGFGNMFSKELGEWFGTRRWLVQAILWVAILNGMVAFILFLVPVMAKASGESDAGFPTTGPELLQMGMTIFFAFAVQAGVIGMTILAQDEIIKEKQTGTAAWILSKPVSRQAFILTKLLADGFGGLIFVVLIPGIIAFFELYLASHIVSPVLPYLQGLGVVFLGLCFYLALALMLGVIFEQRGAVLGIAFGLLFGGMIAVSFFKQIAYVLPVSLQDIAPALALGQPLPPFAVPQLISTALLSVVFVAIALWRFERIEF